jgi:hypothetical protein
MVNLRDFFYSGYPFEKEKEFKAKRERLRKAEERRQRAARKK